MKNLLIFATDALEGRRIVTVSLPYLPFLPTIVDHTVIAYSRDLLALHQEPHGHFLWSCWPVRAVFPRLSDMTFGYFGMKILDHCACSGLGGCLVSMTSRPIPQETCKHGQANEFDPSLLRSRLRFGVLASRRRIQSCLDLRGSWPGK